MAVITFNNEGEGVRAGGNVELNIPIATGTNETVQFLFYNEADSTININFQLAAATHNVSTNDQAGNEIFIRDGANQLIMAPLSAAVVTVSRPLASTTETTGVVIDPTLTSTSHGTVSANGERLIIETVVA